MIKFAAIAFAVVMGISAGAANAADLQLKHPTVKAPPAVAVYNWTGFYIGAHGGASWAHNKFFDVTGGAEVVSFAANGYFGGGQIGYNWQTGPWVLGGELEGSWSHLQRGVCGQFGQGGGFGGGFGGGGFGGGGFGQPGQCSAGVFGRGGFGCAFQCGIFGARIHKIGLLSARLGYAFDRYLLFAKGGAAVADALYVVDLPGIVSVQRSDTRFGWTVGAGIEWAVLGNWSIKAEYNYIDFGTVRLTETGAGGTVVLDHTQRVHLAKFGLNYRFGPWAVAAKY
jgi:outer membrane immunogenic protein